MAKAVLALEMGKGSCQSSERSPEGAEKGRRKSKQRKGIIKIKVEINKSGTETQRKMNEAKSPTGSGFGKINTIDKLLTRKRRETKGQHLC